MSSPRRAMAMVRHGKAAARHPLVFAGKLVAAVVTVAVVSTAGIAGIALADVTGNVVSHPVVHLVQQDGSSVAKSVSASALNGEFNMLLVGSDTRTDQGAQYSDAADQSASSGFGNNDVTMLLHVNAAHTAATVVSFPRDMMVSIPQCPNADGGWYDAMSSQMLNSSLSYGGLACPVLTIENLLGITNINYAAEITFDGVAAMSNAVGGVPVCLATPLSDPYVGLKLPAGTSTLKGQQALEFLRSRHGVDDGSDLSRISSQQNFLSSLLRTTTSAGTLANPVKLFQLADAATKNMTLSDTLRSSQTMVGMALALKGIPLSQITFVQYPVVADPTNANRVVPDETEGPVLAQAIQKDEPVSLSASTGRGTELKGGSTASPSPTAASTSTPSPTQTPGGSTPTSTPKPTAVALGQNATGQTAAEQTCTKGVNAGNF
ncbi:LCP family protein [Gryllotalpicola reticulitermitis]|uniref:LCP family protein n=1 Tax=Gryllotalpicola reticulitermitis TaxID=1184153 RepID=A0ABV8Q916_9MICO